MCEMRRAWDGIGRLARSHWLEWDKLIAKERIGLRKTDRSLKNFNWTRPLKYHTADMPDAEFTVYFDQVYQADDADPAFAYETSDLAPIRAEGMICGCVSQPKIIFLKLLVERFAEIGDSVCVVMHNLPALLSSFCHKSVYVNEFVQLLTELSLQVTWRKPRDQMESRRINTVSRRAHSTSRKIPSTRRVSPRQNSGLCDKWITRRWLAEWEASQDCRMTKRWLPQPSPEVSGDVLGLNRADFGRVVQVITGHDWFAKHISRVANSEDGECRLCCEDDEEAAHLFWDCPAIAAERRRYNRFEPCWRVSGILEFLKVPQINELLGD